MLLDDENIDYINREMSNAVLSMDGRREVNDDLRPTINGKGSYDVIVPKFKKLIAGRGTKDYYLRGTFTRYHKDFAEDVKALAAIGRNVSVEPVVGKESDPYAIQEADLPELKAEYERLAEYLRDHRETNFFHFNVDLEQGPCVIKRLRGCGAGCEYVAVTPEGDICRTQRLHPGGVRPLLGPVLLLRRLLCLQPACRRRHKASSQGGL